MLEPAKWSLIDERRSRRLGLQELQAGGSQFGWGQIWSFNDKTATQFSEMRGNPRLLTWRSAGA